MMKIREVELEKVETKRCELTERDIKLFRFLERFGVISMGQVWAKFFKNMDDKVIPWLFLEKTLKAKGEGSRVYKRLSKLASYGFLERSQWFSPRQTLFRLTTRGHWQLVKREINKFSAPVDGWPYEHELHHSLLVGTAALTLEYMFNWKLKSERELESEYWIKAKKTGYRPDKRVSPDLMAAAAEGAPWMPIELELTLKSDGRYKELWKNMGHGMYGEEPHVLYLAGSSAVQRKILTLAEEFSFPGLYCETLESLKKEWGSCRFRNCSGKLIKPLLCRTKEDALYASTDD